MSVPVVGPTGGSGDDYTVLLVFVGDRVDRFWMARHARRGWELPGGRVEPGESIREAALREWREEVGIPLATLHPLLLQHRPGGDRGHVFVGRSVDDRPPQHLPDPKIVEVRAVDRIDDVSPLAFPDDPYEALARRLAFVGGEPFGLAGSLDAADLLARLVPGWPRGGRGDRASIEQGAGFHGVVEPHPESGR